MNIENLSIEQLNLVLHNMRIYGVSTEKYNKVLARIKELEEK